MNKIFSEWLRMDLHIHTDWSKKTKHGDYIGQFSVDTLHLKLTENNVEVFSLTDHNIINIDAYREYYEKYSGESSPHLLVGVELDIVVTINTPKTYHTLIIFNRSTAEAAQEIHEKLERKYAEKGLDIFERVLSIDEVIELFPNEDFFFIPHAGSNNNIIAPYRENIFSAQRMIILMQSAMEKVSEQRKHIYNQGFDKILPEAFRNRNNHAYIEFSDNHCIEAYPISKPGDEGREHSFYYVKGSKNFETLRQAFIDPESRIKSSSEYCSIKESPQYIESIRLNRHEILQGQDISFSPHLNVLIGGRSTGKSLLLSAIGLKIDSIQNRANQNYPIQSEAIKIKAFQDHDYTDQTSIDSGKVTYIAQGEIVAYFEHGNLQQLAESTGHEDFYKESTHAFVEYKRQISETIESLVESYSSCESLGAERYILHKVTLDALFGDSFTFIWNESKIFSDNDISVQLDEAQVIIENLWKHVADFRRHASITFNEEERTQIQGFLDLVKRKRSQVRKLQYTNRKTVDFLNKVSGIITSKNDALDDGARQKSDARSQLQGLKTKIKARFRSLADLNAKCNVVASLDYSMRRDINLREEIKLVLEVARIPDLNIESLIIEGIKDARTDQSLYVALFNVVHGNTTIKHHGDGRSVSLRKKMQSNLVRIYFCFVKINP